MNIKVIMYCVILVTSALFFLSLSRYVVTFKNYQIVANVYSSIKQQQETEMKDNIPSHTEMVLMFADTVIEFENVSTVLIKKFENRQVFLQYLPNQIILCNGQEIVGDKELEEIATFFIRKKLLKKREGFSIAYQLYQPSFLELGGKIDLMETDELYDTDQERYRIDFYLYEGEYCRWGLKYLSIDDLIPLPDKRGKRDKWYKVKRVFGEKIVDGWYYRVDPYE